MSNIQVTKEELIYLSALAGLDNLWGVEDPFAEKAEASIRADLLNLQDSLLRKGCLDTSVDGRIQLSEVSREMMEVCRNSLRIYILSSDHIEEEKSQLRFFESDRKVVRFWFRETATLTITSKAIMRAELVSFFGDADSEERTGSLVTGVARLKRMGSLSRQRFLYELKNSGCEEDLALLIADGLQGKADFCSVLAFDCGTSGNKLTGKLVTLRFAGGSLMVTPGGENMDSVCFTRLDNEKLQTSLDSLLGVGEDVSVV